MGDQLFNVTGSHEFVIIIPFHPPGGEHLKESIFNATGVPPCMQSVMSNGADVPSRAPFQGSSVEFKVKPEGCGDSGCALCSMDSGKR